MSKRMLLNVIELTDFPEEGDISTIFACPEHTKVMLQSEELAPYQPVMLLESPPLNHEIGMPAGNYPVCGQCLEMGAIDEDY